MEQQNQDNAKNEPMWQDIYPTEEIDLNPEEESFSTYFQPGPTDRSSQYVPGRGVSRYYPALKNLVPMRRKKKNKNNLGVDESGLWSFFTYSWLSKYMYKAYTNGLTIEDIPNPCPQDTCEFNVQRLENLWQDELIKKGPQSASLNCVTWRFIKTRVIVSSILMCICIIIGFLSVAYFMRFLLEYAESQDASNWEGLKWALLLTFSELVRVTLYATVWTTNYRTAIRLRTAFQGMLYRKILRVHSFGGKTIGELINLFSNDGQRIFDLVIFGPMIIGGPISVLLGVYYVYWILGPLPILGLSSIFLFYPIQYYLSRLGGVLKRKVFSITDSRLTVISEILNSIKFIKLYAWAKVYITKISDIRKKELSLLQKVSYCNSFASSLSTCAPVVAGILTFLIHIIFEKNITSSQSVMLLNESSVSLSQPVDKSQSVCIADGCFAYYRSIDDQTKINKLTKRRKSLSLRRNTVPAEEIEKDLLAIQSVSNYTEILFDINFFAPKGSLIGICGPVGCGKTSLLSGILGHLCMTKGKLCRAGTCAYVSQQAWLMNATVRENILFGEKFIARKYYDAVRCCDLGKDIDGLPGGDNTEVGERGINLSGGQKQRMALARALYSDRDIYLLDDPLSAVDSEVAKYIFEECIVKALHNKTVIFVSHQVQFLNQCNEIVVMKDGRIVERGTPNDLLSRDSEYKIIIDNIIISRVPQEGLHQEIKNERKTTLVQQNGQTNKTSEKSKSGIDGVLIREEKTIHGAIKSSTFMSYINACGGVFVFLSLMLVMLLNVGTSAFSSWWLHMWISGGSGNSVIPILDENSTFIEDLNDFENETLLVNDPGLKSLQNESFILNSSTVEPLTNRSLHLINFANTTIRSDNITDNPNYSLYLHVYWCSIIAIFFTSIIRGIVFTKVTLRASSFIHQKLVDKLMKTYMIFFETTPVGRIQNLFSKDIDEVETRLPMTLESLLQGFWNISFSLLFICFAFPWFIAPLAAICFFYYFVHRTFRAGLRELKRLDNSTRSPILSNVSATFHGLDSIHAFGKEKGFNQRFNASFDLNTTCSYMCSIANRWLALRVDIIAVIIMLISSLMVIITHGTVSPSLAGLAIAYATTLCGVLQYTVRLVTDNEVKLISLERINSYLEYMEEEGGHGPKGRPKDTWPELGSIRFKNVELRYRDGLEPALKEVSFHIRSHEKIGIVGRTGAGKSSIVSALFRLVDISKGTITIDSLDIANLDLNKLRSKLSIIPQDPVLFSGTIRSNLDPVNMYNDEEIWSVLEKVSLKNRILAGEDKLNLKVDFNGNNISTGEKQLLCLARALLRQTKILVLDEATSGLDPETENVIQKALFEEMKNCTVIIIAHRLKTIQNCGRVLVMEDGKVAEFDEPKTLLENTSSIFYRMMNASQLDGY